MTKTLRKAIMRRSELQTKFHRTREKFDGINFKRHKNYVSRLYKRERKKYYNNLDLNKITDNKKFWKTVKPLLSRKVSIANSITLINENQIVSDENKVAETLNKFFLNAVDKLEIKNNDILLENNFCNSNQDSIDNIVTKFKSHPSIIEIKRNISCSSKFVFSEINMKDIDQELKHLNTKKANTHKNIPVKILKDFSEVCLPSLLNIINNCLRTCKFPDELKLADVTPIFKKGEKTLAKNYRPISVLPVVSKVLERIMQKQISSHIEKYLSPYLCGYRRGYNTQHALTAMIEKWKRTLDNRGYAGAVLIFFFFFYIKHKIYKKLKKQYIYTTHFAIDIPIYEVLQHIIKKKQININK